MKLSYMHRDTGNALADAYLRGDGAALSLYSYGALSPEAARRRIAELDGLGRPARRGELVAAIEGYMQEVTGVSPGAAELLRQLEDPRAVTVVTGQQAGLFTGPLYTVYKALSTAAWARSLGRELDRPVIPVFWVAAEDHDFDEVASAWYVCGTGEVGRAVLRERPALRTPIGQHVISGAEMQRLLVELALHLPDGMHRADVLETIREAHAATDNMADFFARLMAHWLHDVPMLFVNPLIRPLRALTREAFAGVLADPARFCDAALSGAARVAALGYEPQVEVHQRHSLLYIIDEGKRSPLDFDPALPDQFTLRGTRRHFTRAELEQRLERAPEDFSAGVLFRPVVQDFLLPVAGYVGGAAEIAYHGMMAEVFAAAGRRTPPLALRARVLAIPRPAARSMEKYGMSIHEVLACDPVRGWLREKTEPSIEGVIAAMELAVSQVVQEHASFFTAIDATLAHAVKRTEHAMRGDLGRLHGRADRALRLRHEQDVRSLGALCAWLAPNAQEQERTLSPLSLISKYGSGWTAYLAGIDPPAWDDVFVLEW